MVGANELGADGLPVHDWAPAADVLLSAQDAVRSAKVRANHEEDELELDGPPLATLSVAVVVEALDAPTAAALVQRTVVEALRDVVAIAKLAGRRTTGMPRRSSNPSDSLRDREYLAAR